MIRPYRVEDTEDLLNVWYEVARSTYRLLSVETIDSIKEDIRNKYLYLSDSWVAEYKGDIIGFISIIDGVVGGLFVLPAYQNMGIGKSLINHVKEIKDTISLDVLKQNSKAIKFYEKCGFVPTKEGICPVTNLDTVTVKLD